MPLPSLEQESDSPLFLPPTLAPAPSSHKDVTDDVLIYAGPPAPFNDSYEFEVGEQFDTAGELDMSITSEVEHHNLDESNGLYL